MASFSWYYPVLYVLAELYFFLGTTLLPAPDMPLRLVTVAFAGVGLLILVFSFPLLSVFLYRDTKAIAETGQGWEPNPLLYAGLGATTLLTVIPHFMWPDLPSVNVVGITGSVVASATLPLNVRGVVAFSSILVPFGVCLWYLYQRKQRIGLTSSLAPAVDLEP